MSDHAYDSLYAEFDSPLMRRVRSQAYGEDIGQHSWVTARELRADLGRLGLAASHRFLDLGCGPCGPLTFAVRAIGCRALGLDASKAAIIRGRERITSLGLERLAMVQQADLNDPLPLDDGSFDAAIALDVVLHVRDRAALFREVARVLTAGGRFLFTDAGVLVGAISSAEVAARSANGPTQFVAQGFNERALESAGFELLEVEDRTESVIENATGRLAARLAHQRELEQAESAAGFDRQQQYLETVIALARRRAVSRTMYLASSHD
ncbi:MAG TPA: methyltransferase domain-containing protein [Gemmatimonadaceae bacterium]|nr:methyltransferase domain-containing protein [Gemmatimonadaceae bacterium]